MVKGMLRVLAGAAAAGMITSSASAVVMTTHSIDFGLDPAGTLIDIIGGTNTGSIEGGVSLSEKEKVSGNTTTHITFTDSVPGVPLTVIDLGVATDGNGVLVSTDTDNSGLIMMSDVPISEFMASVGNLRTGFVNTDDELMLKLYDGAVDAANLLGMVIVPIVPTDDGLLDHTISATTANTGGAFWNTMVIQAYSTVADGATGALLGVAETVDNIMFTTATPDPMGTPDTPPGPGPGPGPTGGNGNNAVPEPISAALGLMGLGALGTATRRRR